MKPAKRTSSLKAERPVVQKAPAEQERDLQAELAVDLKSEMGRMTIVGTSTAVIAALAVIGLIVISIYVVRLAERAIDRTQYPVPVRTAP